MSQKVKYYVIFSVNENEFVSNILKGEAELKEELVNLEIDCGEDETFDVYELTPSRFSIVKKLELVKDE